MPLSDRAEKEIKDTTNRREDELLEALSGKGRGASLEELAKLLGWLHKNNQPNKQLVHRTAKALIDSKLVRNRRDRLELTDAGRAELKKKGGDDEVY